MLRSSVVGSRMRGGRATRADKFAEGQVVRKKLHKIAAAHRRNRWVVRPYYRLYPDGAVGESDAEVA